jgi:endonuclease/exonuclease/phosphatase family metal-dependent hydrolase
MSYCAFSKSGINAVFSKYRFEAEELNLGEDPIMKMPRNAIICRFNQLISGPRDMIVAGCHLDVFDESGKTRIEQMEMILNTTNRFANDITGYNISIIVMGDFNSLRKADYNNEEWAYITALGKKRNVKVIEDVIPVIENNEFVESFTACQKNIKTSVWVGRRVDYIYGKNLNFDQTSEYKVLHSDHYPIYADIQ